MQIRFYAKGKKLIFLKTAASIFIITLVNSISPGTDLRRHLRSR